MANYERRSTDRPATYGDGLEDSGIFDREESGSAPTSDPIATNVDFDNVYELANILPPSAAYISPYTIWKNELTEAFVEPTEIYVIDGVLQLAVRFNNKISVEIDAQLAPRNVVCTFRAEIASRKVEGSEELIYPYVEMRNTSGQLYNSVVGEPVEIPLAEERSGPYEFTTVSVQYTVPFDDDDNAINNLKFGFLVGEGEDDSEIEEDSDSFLLIDASAHQGEFDGFRDSILIPNTFQGAITNFRTRSIIAEDMQVKYVDEENGKTVPNIDYVNSLISAAINGLRTELIELINE